MSPIATAPSKWQCRKCAAWLVDVLGEDGKISTACGAGCDGPLVLVNVVRQLFERSKAS
jgi:hypothetical protein